MRTRAVARSGPSNTYGITGPTKAGHQYNKFRRLSREFPISGMVRNPGFRGSDLVRLTHRCQAVFAGLWMETGDRLRFLAVDVEDRVELGDLQEIGHFLIEVQELQFPARAFDHAISAY